MRALGRVAMAALLSGMLVVTPALAAVQQGQEGSPAAMQQTQEGAQGTPPGQTTEAPSSLPRSVSLGPDYSIPKPFFPNIIEPYTPRHVEEPMMTNTPKLDQLVKDGKVYLSLDDAISIALEDNLDISVQRFTPWIAETQLLKAKAGGIPQTGSTQQVVLGSAPSVSFDPILTSSLSTTKFTSPVNNPFLSGTGTLTSTVGGHQDTYNFGYSQGFHLGTNVSLTFDNTRSSTTVTDVLYNPAVQSTVTFTVTQPLLNGFGLLPNTRYILEAKNSIKDATSIFTQQVITTVTAVATDYWELVYARENVKVAEAAVGVDEKLYNDNKKQLEIGTMAPLDVLTAESQLASDQQVLVQAQTTQLQDETVLLVAITKEPLAGNLAGIEIIPTTSISLPEAENVTLESAVKEAWANRPELQQAGFSLANSKIEVKATKNELLPSLNLYGQYSQTGLAGNAVAVTETATGYAADLQSPILMANNAPPPTPLYLGEPTGFTTTSQVVKTGGLGDALDSMIHYNFPTATGGISLTLPIRNRSAQADNARSLLDERQQQVQYQSTKNAIVLNVRNALIALTQDRAAVAAAQKARTLAQQTLDDEQKKYQLGTSTSYNVVLRARDLTAAEGTELRDKINLIEAELNFNEAVGRTLQTNHIIVADALRGKTGRDPLIPGTPDWDATPGEK
ncbi:MAG TPA: TolC family protein [Verrucomicrobiae bacterium]|nr:TolC family protein [Verrucomicrobiae bacterium]